ncbi:hypothetical protein THIOKS1880002 [Thiocapsa sp. KS1]|nr:hypothetical protein THIOKS1880002 [Thiocapsa sp. KS1]
MTLSLALPSPGFNSLNGYGLDDTWGDAGSAPGTSFNSLNGYGLDDTFAKRFAKNRCFNSLNGYELDDGRLLGRDASPERVSTA